MEKNYDLVVIGSGPGGYVAAIRAAQLGASVACVESRDLGGTCLNRGCIPTKALVKAAHMVKDFNRAEEFGFHLSDLSIDLEQVMKRKDEVVSTLVGGVEKLFSSNGVDYYPGRGSIPAPGKVKVEGEDESFELKTENIMIATGSCQKNPPVDEEDLKHTISSDDALELTEIPEKMVVIGGGVLAVEFACIYNTFGTEVEMIKRSPLILPPIDPEISRRLMALLRREGIKINTGIYIKGIEAEDENTKRIVADNKKGEEVSFSGDAILVAMGRNPDFGGLDLDGLGIDYTEEGIQVDEYLETSVPGIYAIGDVLGRYYLASVASAEGILVTENLFSEGEKEPMEYNAIPQVVFSDPEVASVGLTDKEARKEGIPASVSKFPFSANGKAVALGETNGIVKLVAEEGDGRLIGAHLMGPAAGDLVHETALAVKMGATAREVGELIHAHPTLSENIMEAAEGIYTKPIHLMKRGRRR